MRYYIGTLKREINAFDRAMSCTMSVTKGAGKMMNVDSLVPVIWIHAPVTGMGHNLKLILYSLFSTT